ncbi:MAG: polymer-forming cytoskeletal protein [Phycisphaerales bacterium]|nr:polymer-forming cytoskeletal protein [Phycisphaerales bacterium]
MADFNGEYPTVLGTDAQFKGELSFEKGVRIEGSFDGQIHAKGALHIAEGAKITANVEAANVKIEGECRGNLIVSEKLHLLATAKMEGDLRTNRLEIADGAIFVGKVIVGQASEEPPMRRPSTAQSTAPAGQSGVGARAPVAKVGQPPIAPQNTPQGDQGGRRPVMQPQQR